MAKDDFILPRGRVVEMYLQKLQAATLLFFSGSSLAGDVVVEAEMFCRDAEITGKEVNEHYRKPRQRPNKILDTLKPEEEAVFATLMKRLTPHLRDGNKDQTTEGEEDHEQA